VSMTTPARTKPRRSWRNIFPMGFPIFGRFPIAGGAGNVFRCLEECQTEWLWILSDDDPALPDAVAGLLAVCATNAVILFMRPPIYSVSNRRWWCLMSLRFWNIPDSRPCFGFQAGFTGWLPFVPCSEFYNESLSTWGPHMIMVLSLLESGGGKVLLSPLMLRNRTHPTHLFNFGTPCCG